MHALPYWRLSGYYFFYFAFVGVFSPYFGLYLQSLDFSAWDIGLLMSQMQLMRLFGPNLWGWLADRWQQRIHIIRWAGFLSLAGFSAFLWLDRLPGMLLAMAVLAFFWSAALPLVETLTLDHLRDQTARYGRIRLWGSIGFIVAVMGAGALLDWLPLRSVVWVCFAVLLGIWLLALVLPEAGGQSHQAASLPVREILRQAPVQALLLACVAMSAAHGALYVFYSIHLADHGYNKFEIGLLWSLGVVAEILVFLVMPRLLHRYGLRKLLLLSFAAAVLRFLLIGAWVDVLLIALFAQCLHGLTFGAYHASAVAAIGCWFPGRAQARGQALYSSLSFGAGGLLGNLVAGWTWEWIGAGWTYALSAAFAGLGFMLIVWQMPQTGADGSKSVVSVQ